MRYELHWEILITQTPFILEGLWTTLWISVTSMALALIFGIFIVLFRISRRRSFRYVAITWIEFWRGIPLLVALVWFTYGIAAIIGIRFDPYIAGILILGLNAAAYQAEIYRAGIEALPKGQHEASRSLGLSYRKTMRFVILPQAFRIILPPTVNNFVTLIKNSVLVSVIGIYELMLITQQVVSNTFRPFELYTVMAAIFLLIILFFSWLGGIAERWSKRAGTL
jgi:His/Glu/Gln/Arg/opine family amino acid ABC transporter permease subunit